MSFKGEIFWTGSKEQIWQKYCGFLDLSIKEFMNIQKHLLMEEIELVWDSPLGKKIIGDKKPESVEEFRQIIPFTTYKDYAPYLEGQSEKYLAIKPASWVHTSGRGGSFKWVPCAERFVDLWCDTPMASMILASANRKGEVNIHPGFRLLHNFPARPYGSGLSLYSVAQRIPLRTIPPVEESEKMQFQERIAKGFGMALRTRVDIVTSMSSVLIKTGDAFAERSPKREFSRSMLHPLVIYRMLRASFWAWRRKRPVLPRDIWPEIKGIISWGTDTDIYKDKIKSQWGKPPHELYVFTEGGILAVQGWNKKGMTFFPNVSFLEFIPEEEWLKSKEDESYQPLTVLLDEMKAGKQYELVSTNFYGMPFLRYRVGDLIKIVSIGDEEMGTSLPQIDFAGRADELIDVFGIARLDEQTVWQAIANAGITYEDWTLRKESEGDEPMLHLYVEPKENRDAEEIGRSIHQQLIDLDQHYREATEEIGTIPWKVTVLPRGSFQHYFEERRKAGADLSHLRPPHMNASDDVIQLLC